jgi:hypothetical protein
MNKNQENKMVENVNFVPMMREITVENATLELKRLENLSFSKSMSEEEKKEFILSRASHEIIEWFCKTTTRKTSMNWVRFKEELEEFCSPNKLDLGDVFRLKQEKTQTICDFIKLVEESSRPHKFKNEEKIKIILTGLREEIPDVRRLIIRSKIIDDVLIEDIHLLEETFLEEKGKEGARKEGFRK